jgi:hypothetical protein
MKDAADIQSAAVARPLYIAGTLAAGHEVLRLVRSAAQEPDACIEATVTSRNPAPIQVRGRPCCSAIAMARMRPAKASRNKP